MKILVFNGSPRPRGSTAAMVKAFAAGTRESGYGVDIVDVRRMNIAGCLACKYCHTKGAGKCIQQDDIQQVYPLLEQTEMIVLASTIYCHNFAGQLQCAINRIFALNKPKKLKKAALILSSEANHVYSGAIFEYQNSFLNYLNLEDMGVYSACGKENKSVEKLAKPKVSSGFITFWIYRFRMLDVRQKSYRKMLIGSFSTSFSCRMTKW